MRMKIAVVTNRMIVDPLKISKRWPMRKGRRKVPGMVTTHVVVLLCSSGQGFFKILKGGCRDRRSKVDRID